MKTSIILLIAFLITVVYSKPDEKYTTKYDNIDLDSILQSDRLLGNYVKCILDKGKCTPDGAELKRLLPDGLQTKCSKCSEKQREGVRKVINHLIKNKRQWFDEIQVKYDPQNIYLETYKDELKKEGIIL